MIIKDEMIKNDPDYLGRQLLLFRTFLSRRCPTLPLQGLKSVISLFAGNKKARQAAVSPNNTFSLTAHNNTAQLTAHNKAAHSTAQLTAHNKPCISSTDNNDQFHVSLDGKYCFLFNN